MNIISELSILRAHLDLKDIPIEPIILYVTEELRITFPERIVTVDFEVKKTINCDADRISQLLSNLVANALTHGLPQNN